MPDCTSVRRIDARAGLLAGLCASLLAGCTDSTLYGKGVENTAADRLALRGRVCTEDPRQAGFRSRVVFVVDTHGGPLFSAWDTELLRLRALRELLAQYAANESYSFAIVGLGAVARLFAPQSGYFTRNPGELDAAVGSLALPTGCVAGTCRDYGSALQLVRSLIEGDLADLYTGQSSRTQYAVIFVTAGPPIPLNCAQDCCDPSVEACGSGCTRSWPCTQTFQREAVYDLRLDVEAQGASALSFHGVLLAATDGGSDAAALAQLDMTEQLLRQMAFGGAGTAQRFGSADAITFSRISLLRLSALLDTKLLLVDNASVLPGGAGGPPLLDSDRDGLADQDEAGRGTDPLARDTDTDGVGDLIEVLLDYDPRLPDPPAPVCQGLTLPYGDLDSDGLNDCEELLLGTDPSLTDSDGDGVPDWIEVVRGTDYLRNDTLLDSDWDGVPNGDETLKHTDPRSSDMASHLATAYRYDLSAEGLIKQPLVLPPRRLNGVSITAVGEDATPGLGQLSWAPGPPATLSWRDPSDTDAGYAEPIGGSGTYTLWSWSGDHAGQARWLMVAVDQLLLPPTPIVENLRVDLAERSCVSYTVRNIRLGETLGGGRNDIFLWFAQALHDRMTQPGIFRLAHVPVVYREATGRDPPDLVLEVRDEEFVPIGY